jgi:hypothetical protein
LFVRSRRHRILGFPCVFQRNLTAAVILLLPFFTNPALLFASGQPTGGAATSGFDGPAELPRVNVRSSIADTPAGGKTWQAKSGDDLRSMLKQANCGDTIQLLAGTTFDGAFTLPAKNCNDGKWIIIRSSASDTSLPAEGSRISPCFAGVASLPGRPALNCASTQKVMATLMATKGGGPLVLASGANHYRLGPGLEITRAAGTGINYNLIAPQESTPADHIIVDRDWVHGTAQDDTTRGVYLSGVTDAAVVDSYFNDFHCTAGIGSCTDSQAIAGGLGNLPQGNWKIENNFLEAAAENILFGGGAGSVVPTDIEIRHNYIFKPLIWMPGQPGFVGGVNNDPSKCVQFKIPGFCPFVVKNLFELKNAQRLLFEGNVLEYTWPGFTQHGAALLLTALSQGGKVGNPNATVADITIRYNLISHAASGVVIAEAAYAEGPPKLEARISIHDDVFNDIGPAYGNGDSTLVVGMAFQLSFCPTCAPIQDVSINHVTMLMDSPRTFMVLGAPLGRPIQNLTFTNNIVSSPSGLAVTGTGAKAPCGFQGNTAVERISSCVSPLRFEANALVGSDDNWPRGNFFPHDLKTMKFESYASGRDADYRLSPDSPHKTQSTDGKDLGADIDAVMQQTANVRVSVPVASPIK